MTDDYVKEKDFQSFVDNHFEHLKNKVDKIETKLESISDAVSFIRGWGAVVIPLALALLAAILTLSLRGG